MPQAMDPLEIHMPLLGSPGPGPMYRPTPPPLIGSVVVTPYAEVTRGVFFVTPSLELALPYLTFCFHIYFQKMSLLFRYNFMAKEQLTCAVGHCCHKNKEGWLVRLETVAPHVLYITNVPH